MIPDKRAYIGLGSNLDDPEWQVRRAVERLKGLPDSRWLGCSSLYRTRPWGRGGQPGFINAVAALDCGLRPEDLLVALLAIEAEAGRSRDGERWGPRILDLDLLLHGERRLATRRLTLPHPRLHERAFALVPLIELDPAIEIPGRGAAADCLERLEREGIERVGALE